MFVTFVGAPCSGKTTTSARLFADLKERGLPVEYLTEYARMYIATLRHVQGDAFCGLGNLDQAAILEQQAKHEDIISADSNVLVIADSCAMSALLYMTDDYIERVSKMNDHDFVSLKSPLTIARERASKYDIIFRCSPVRPGVGYDPNRIHSYEQSLEIDKRIDRAFEICDVDRKKVFPLFGDTRLRVSESSGVLMPRLVSRMVSR